MTQKRNEHMVLSAFLMPAGYDLHAWCIEGSRAEEFGELGVLVDLARRFEAAKFDSIFIADTLGSDYIRQNDMAMGNPYEPLISLSALISNTTHIGLIGTVSTTFTHPYQTARQLAALDMLSGGRTGWNIVTSSWGGDAFGIPLPPRDVRYRRAEEFVAVAQGLWSCWGKDTIIVDRSTRRWADPDQIRPFKHKGEFFEINDTYLNIPPSPQRHTVLVQAGQSAGGLALGARVAEIIYTVQPEIEPAIVYYREQKERMAQVGRNPDHVKILPGLIPYVGRTEEEARNLLNQVVAHMNFDKLREDFAKKNQIDLTGVGLGDPIPRERFDEAAKKQDGSRIYAYRDYAVQEGRTLRDMLINVSSAMGHILCIGTAEQVADEMIEWFERRACDGFSVNAPSFPGSVDTICELLIPELQRRGYARTEYPATTLRGNLGLPMPKAWNEA